jgi:hypothetical protein
MNIFCDGMRITLPTLVDMEVMLELCHTGGHRFCGVHIRRTAKGATNNGANG